MILHTFGVQVDLNKAEIDPKKAKIDPNKMANEVAL